MCVVSPRGQPPQRQLAAKFFFQKDTIAPPPYVCVHACRASATKTILAFPHCSASLWGVLWECASMVVLIAASIVEYSLGTLSML